MEFDENYYEGNSQDRDRPALWFYQRIWKKYCGGKLVLEFGCGVGFFAKRLSEFATVYGLEINDYARKQFLINAPLATPIDDMNILSSNSLDSIVSLHVLEHIPDIELREVGVQFNRVLKANGRLLIVVPNLSGAAKNLHGINWMGFRDITHVNLKTSSDWVQWFDTEWSMNVEYSAADGYYAFPYGKALHQRIFADFSRLARTGIQFLLGRLVLAPNDGEAVIFVLKKK